MRQLKYRFQIVFLNVWMFWFLRVANRLFSILRIVRDFLFWHWMPPKTWKSPAATVSTPSLGSKPPQPAAAPGAQQKVETYVIKELSANNLLGISDEEIRGAAKQFSSCASKKEVFDWCSTFMLEETVAAEVIKMRDDNGPYFEGTAPRVSAATASTLRLGSSSNNKKPGPRKKMPLSTLSDAHPLVEGMLFECGCFALSHSFKGNCHNCGRIFCAQESLDSCYHCGLDPSRCLAYDLKVESGKLDEAAQQKNAEGYAKALAKRDELLQFAREKTKRTSVVDDQSGVFLESTNAWSTKEQRDAAADAAAAERRKKIVSLHKSSGAYTVHLDIVNQNVALGARIDDFKTSSECLPGASAAAAPVDSVDYEDETYLDEELPELDSAVRVSVNPAVTQKFWYVDNAEQADQHYSKQTKSKPGSAQPSCDPPIPTAAKKENCKRSIMESCRLQNDYFEEDDEHYFGQGGAAVASSSTPHQSTAGEHILGGCIEFFVSKAPALEDTGTSISVEPTASRELLEQFEQPPANGVTKTMRMRDDGMCLSMHQPWASLLVAGIKTHEGRTWTSDYRGKLWIHAAAAKPSDIPAIEAHYAPFCPKGVAFPPHYPTGCLLGYVYVTDCLDHAAYTERFPEKERQEDSPYKLICAEAKALPMPLPMEGKHKIFKLDRKIFLAAKHQLNEK